MVTESMVRGWPGSTTWTMTVTAARRLKHAAEVACSQLTTHEAGLHVRLPGKGHHYEPHRGDGCGLSWIVGDGGCVINNSDTATGICKGK